MKNSLLIFIALFALVSCNRETSKVSSTSNRCIEVGTGRASSFVIAQNPEEINLQSEGSEEIITQREVLLAANDQEFDLPAMINQIADEQNSKFTSKLLKKGAVKIQNQEFSKKQTWIAKKITQFAAKKFDDDDLNPKTERQTYSLSYL